MPDHIYGAHASVSQSVGTFDSNQHCEDAEHARLHAEMGNDMPTTHCVQSPSAAMTCQNTSVEWCPAFGDNSLDVTEVLQAAFCRTRGKQQDANLAGESCHAKPVTTCKTRNKST